MNKTLPSTATTRLAQFVSALDANQVPDEVFDRITNLFVDWAGSCLSSKGHRAIEAIAGFAREMGPQAGPGEILIDRSATSPLFAAMVNAAASHVSEQDDVHNGSVFHPATIVFPAALAVAQQRGSSGRDFLTACIAGYEAGIRIGEALGRSHYTIFHTTGTAGTFAAAAAVGNLIGLDPAQMLNAFGSAGTQSAGLWQFLRDGADSKQLHTAKSSAEGLMAAFLAEHGFTGARDIIEGEQGLMAGTTRDANLGKLDDRLGERWCVMETSFKFHASCRHTHPAADALLKVVEDNNLAPGQISRVDCHVHQAAIDVLGPVRVPTTVHQAKFCMAATLGLIASHRRAGIREFENVLSDKTALSFLDRIHMQLDEEVDAIYPERWIGKVTVETGDGRILKARVDEPKGDPGNTLTRDEIDHKARMLACFGDAVTETELDPLMQSLWTIGDAARVSRIFAGKLSP